MEALKFSATGYGKRQQKVYTAEKCAANARTPHFSLGAVICCFYFR